MTLRNLAVRAATLLLTVSAVVTVAGPRPAAAGTTITTDLVKSGLNGPAAFTFTPKGIIYYLERGTGEVRVLNPNTGHDRLFFHIHGVNGSGERGALGIALHPKWPTKPFAYVYVTRNAGGHLRNQIIRIHMKHHHGVGFQVLMQAPASSNPYHNGGRILFGPDGMLYAIVGDGHDSSNSQDRSKNLRGKILRIAPDGSIPAGNPFGHNRIWAFGIRNSFGFTFDPHTDRLWETENGPECNDEINLIVKGGNFGWGPKEDCGGPAPKDTNDSGPKPRHLPKTYFRSTIGITGDAFCVACGLGGTVDGDLFFGQVNPPGSLWRVALNPARNDTSGAPIHVLDPSGGAILSMETAPDGTIYLSDFDAIYRLVT
jgi:glucose/arabinose dehydrogenase